jgi:LTXXQ motif family protein
MTRTRKIVIGGLAVAAIVGGVAAASAHRHGNFGSGGGMHGGKGMMGMGMMGAVCRGDGAQMADMMMVGLEYKVKPTDAQKPAFEELKAAARAAAAKAQAGCPKKPTDTAEGAPRTPKAPTERLAMMETGLTAQLEAIRTVRPVAEKFYASLSDEQKKALSEGREGRGGWGHREGRGDRGGEGYDRGERSPRGGEGTPPAKP